MTSMSSLAEAPFYSPNLGIPASITDISARVLEFSCSLYAHTHSLTVSDTTNYTLLEPLFSPGFQGTFFWFFLPL